MVHTQYEYHEVHGSSVKALRRDMSAKAIKGDPDGGTYDANTAWYDHWNYKTWSTNYDCRIIAVKTSVDVTFKFPKWSPSPNAPLELKNEWNRYMKCLHTHEDGHKAHAVKAAQEIERALMAMGPQVNCDVLNSEANALGKSIIARYNQEDVDYDRQTQHGKTQGAAFPKNYRLKKGKILKQVKVNNKRNDVES